jgi:uncharacterized protein YkwD
MFMGLKNIIIIFIILVGSYCCKKENNTTNENSLSDSNKQTLLNLVNDARLKGCDCGAEKMPPVGPVVWNDLLESAAKEHSQDMFDKNFLNHVGSDGSTTADRLTKTGFQWTSCGENIALGFKTEQQVVEAWLNSPVHCKNIMTASYKYMGVARSDTYWTQVFAGK